MRIKKHSNKNEYLLTYAGMWVRNFHKMNVPYIDINKITQTNEYALLLKNEIINTKNRYAWIDSEDFQHDKIVIVSDGYKFEEMNKVLEKLPKDVAIMAVNGALTKWKGSRTPTYYVVNNPYVQCMQYKPKSIFPKCIASTRTYHEYLEKYKGAKYRYMPVSEEGYAGPKSNEINYQIDDYRNPICAAIGLAYQFDVKKLVLACCDDSFDTERPGADKLPNGLYQYPQQKIPHSLIEGNLYSWLRSSKPDLLVRNASFGLECRLAAYIEKDSIVAFFEDKEDEQK